MNRKFKLDKLTLIFTFMLALCALVLMIFMMNIIDRSADHVTQIKKVNVAGPSNNFTDALVTESELARFSVSDRHSDHPECYVTDHKLSPQDYERIAEIKNLRQLTLKRCDLDAQMLDKITSLPIKSLRIAECDLSKAMFERLGKLKKLRHAEFYKCDFEANSLATFHPEDLHWLQIRECRNSADVKALTAGDFANLRTMKNLNRLELERTRTVPGTLKALENTSVILLNCAHCFLTDDDLPFLTKLPNLNWLDVSHNEAITCKGLRTLLSAPQIDHIKVELKDLKCKFSDAELERLSRKSFKPPDWLSRKQEN